MPYFTWSPRIDHHIIGVNLYQYVILPMEKIVLPMSLSVVYYCSCASRISDTFSGDYDDDIVFIVVISSASPVSVSISVSITVIITVTVTVNVTVTVTGPVVYELLFLPKAVSQMFCLLCYIVIHIHSS